MPGTQRSRRESQREARAGAAAAETDEGATLASIRSPVSAMGKQREPQSKSRGWKRSQEVRPRRRRRRRRRRGEGNQPPSLAVHTLPEPHTDQQHRLSIAVQQPVQHRAERAVPPCSSSTSSPRSSSARHSTALGSQDHGLLAPVPCTADPALRPRHQPAVPRTRTRTSSSSCRPTTLVGPRRHPPARDPRRGRPIPGHRTALPQRR